MLTKASTIILNTSLDLEEHPSLPIIQLRNLIKLNNSSSEHLLIASFDSLNEQFHEFGLTSGRECRVL